MIPIQLIIKNFLSYRDAALDFSGLHTACICGSNGAGKSSLLEAITWAIWGESRATVEDDVIHSGAKEVRIDFTFQSGQQTYRVIRNRVRGGTSILEFQIETTSGFRALTGKGLKATQDVILEHIKLDYETFINSAYLRQGKADEFMLKRPAERKEILAELLKLNQYDELEERAKNSFKIYRIRGEDLERSLENIKVQLQQREITENQRAELEAQLQDLQQVQTFENSQLQSLQVIQHQRQNWEQQLNFLRQRYDNLSQDSDRLQQEQIAVKSQLADLEKILNQEVDIQAGYTQYQNLQSQEEILSGKFEQHTRATNLKQQKQQQLYKQTQDLERQLQQAEAQLAALEQQEQEIIQTLSKSGDIETALSQLNNARQHLANLDQLQMQVTPLLQQRVKLQTQLDRTHASLVAKLEQIQATEKQLQNQHHRQPQLQQALIEIGTQIEELEKKRVYLQRVQEKGQERRHFIERLQAHQGDYEKLLAELEQKLQMLQNPDALCPLCERPLDEHHWSKVIEKTQSEYEDTQGQFWVVREQMAFSDREIQVLRQEYREISQKLSGYDSLREKRGQLAAQLQATTDVQQQLLQIISEKEHLERSLEIGDYAPEKQAEIQELDHYLQQLNYSEQDHSLARSEVDKFRWAEIKQGQIKDALKRQAQLIAKKPELTTNISQLQLQLQQGQTDSNFAQEIANLEQQISEIAYNYEQHNYLRQSVRQGQSWQLRHQQLLSAQEQYPQFRNKSQDLEYSLQTIFQERQTLIQQIDNIVKQLSDSANPTAQINTLEQQLANRRRELDNKISQL